MEQTELIWFDGDFVPWEKAQVHVLTHGLHYGSGVFEGIRCYETAKGAAVFRLPDHIDRLFYSAKVLRMPLRFTNEQIFKACVEVVRQNKIQTCYIRPIMFYAYEKLGVNPKTAPVSVAIACWPWGAYLPYDSINVKISSFFRIHPRTSYTDAKICGNYVNSIVAAQQASAAGYQEALLLDYAGNIAEGPGENFFIVKDGALYTPKLGSILPGITRATILEVAKSLGITCHESDLRPEDAYQAAEVFFTGTAAEVTPIRSIDDKVIGSGKMGPITQKLKNAYADIVQGKNEKYHRFLTFVNC